MTTATQTISDKDFKHMIEQGRAQELITKISSGNRSSHRWATSWWDASYQGYICADASLMRKHNTNIPDTIFDSATSKIIPAWKMLPSQQKQEEISVSCALAPSYDASKPVKIIMHLLAQEQGSGNAHIKITLHNTLQQPLTNYSVELSTGNFQITNIQDQNEPMLYVIEAILPTGALKPNCLATFTFNRITPTGDLLEYDQAIYLQNVMLVYEKL